MNGNVTQKEKSLLKTLHTATWYSGVSALSCHVYLYTIHIQRNKSISVKSTYLSIWQYTSLMTYIYLCICLCLSIYLNIYCVGPCTILTNQLIVSYKYVHTIKNYPVFQPLAHDPFSLGGQILFFRYLTYHFVNWSPF